MRVLLPILLATVLAAAQTAPKTPMVAVMPLTPQGVEPASALVVTDALSDELIRAKGMRVMERSQMELILKEQGFQQSGACEASECAIQVGKILSIDRMIIGSIGKIGESYTLSVRSVDVGSGEILGSARRMSDGPIEKVLTDLLPLVVQDLSSQQRGAGEKASSGSGRRWLWWTAGGAALAAGGTAAFLLLDDAGEEAPTPPATVGVGGRWK